jgi:xylose isomerase
MASTWQDYGKTRARRPWHEHGNKNMAAITWQEHDDEIIIMAITWTELLLRLSVAVHGLLCKGREVLQGNSMARTWQEHGNNSGHVIAMLLLLLWSCHGLAMFLPWFCHALAIWPCPCHTRAMFLPCLGKCTAGAWQ